MEYKLANYKANRLDKEEIGEFENIINNLMKEGWIPQGGFYYNTDRYTYCQAMIRHKKTQTTIKPLI
jgi:hypothetical protein